MCPMASTIPEKILVVDVGGTHAKFLMTGWTEKREADSGPAYTPTMLLADMERLLAGATFDAVTIGLPIPMKAGKGLREPANLGAGWKDFDFVAAFGKPTKVLNDAAKQAVGGYVGGRMLFLGLGTGLGSCLIEERHVLPLELAHLPYKKRKTFEEYVGVRAKEKLGKKKWREEVASVISILQCAILPDSIVLGGGNAKDLKELPAGCLLGDNANAFAGGFAVWQSRWTGI